MVAFAFVIAPIRSLQYGEEMEQGKASRGVYSLRHIVHPCRYNATERSMTIEIKRCFF
jgi:hypothetical protein